jgi:hypothetical protein
MTSKPHIARLYELSERPAYGQVEGVCRVTGLPGRGVPFDKWVKKTFTDWQYLCPGDIVSNEALLTFDEKSEEIKRRTGKEKAQKFRSYSHFIVGGRWALFTKANKVEMWNALFDATLEMAVIADSGQKHLVFKHQPGTWQLEELQVYPDPERLRVDHLALQTLLAMGFNQKEAITGTYPAYKLARLDSLTQWLEIDTYLKTRRQSGLFQIAAFLLFPDETIQLNDARTTSPPAATPPVPVHSGGIQGQLF